jgi:hypothetical protein
MLFLYIYGNSHMMSAVPKNEGKMAPLIINHVFFDTIRALIVLLMCSDSLGHTEMSV